MQVFLFNEREVVTGKQMDTIWAPRASYKISEKVEVSQLLENIAVA